MRYMPRPAHSSRFYHPHNIGWAVQNINSSLCSFLHSPVTSSLLGPKSTCNLLVIVIVRVIMSLAPSPVSSAPFSFTIFPLITVYFHRPLAVVLCSQHQRYARYSNSSVYAAGVGQVTSFIQDTLTPVVCNTNTQSFESHHVYRTNQPDRWHRLSSPSCEVYIGCLVSWLVWWYSISCIGYVAYNDGRIYVKYLDISSAVVRICTTWFNIKNLFRKSVLIFFAKK
jgi:hypothetical protein